MQVRDEYNQLLESGDLMVLFPGAKGEWELDKKQFTQIYEANQKVLNQFDEEDK